MYFFLNASEWDSLKALKYVTNMILTYLVISCILMFHEVALPNCNYWMPSWSHIDPISYFVTQ